MDALDRRKILMNFVHELTKEYLEMERAKDESYSFFVAIQKALISQIGRE